MPDTRDYIMILQSSLRAYRSCLGKVGRTDAECAQSLAELTLANTDMLLHLGREIEKMDEALSEFRPEGSHSEPQADHGLLDAAPEPIEPEQDEASSKLQKSDQESQV